MIVYEKNNKLNINFDNEVSENPDLQISKEDGKTEILIDGESSPSIPTPTAADEGKALVADAEGGYSLESIKQEVETYYVKNGDMNSGTPVLYKDEACKQKFTQLEASALHKRLTEGANIIIVTPGTNYARYRPIAWKYTYTTSSMWDYSIYVINIISSTNPYKRIYVYEVDD